MASKKTCTLSFKIDKELFERIDNRAIEEQRNRSNFVVKILTDYLNKVDEAKKLILKP